MGRRNRNRLISLLLFLVLAWVTQSQKPSAVPPSPTPTPHEVLGEKRTATDSAVVKRVIDGDTIELASGQKVRYIGIDTPEISFQKNPECFATESHTKNKELVEGKTITLEKDISETDRYGRLLRYVRIDNTFINDYLVREGYAFARSYPPDIKYQMMLKKAEEEARNNKRGLWGDLCQPATSSPTPLSKATEAR